MIFSSDDKFSRRHIGPRPAQLGEMLETVEANSLDTLINEAIPAEIRLKEPLRLSQEESEFEYLKRISLIADKNKTFKSFIGMGYYGCIVPSVILRNVLENPGWYSPYTPYQAEIAQGRLEALFLFQTLVSDLTGMEISTASLLDEATAAAEAMTMLHRIHSKRHSDANVFIISDKCFPQTIDVVTGRADPLGIEIQISPIEDIKLNDRVFGLLLQNPDNDGRIHNLQVTIDRAHASGKLVAVCTDLLSLTLMKPPGELGVDVVVGSSQRLGVPMGYGGPHAAFFATKEQYVRQAPGRIIAQSIDANGNPAYRMALQTREQHIRREKATSNICTAQALLASMSGLYAVYHGPIGLTGIAKRIHSLAKVLDNKLKHLGYLQTNDIFFDTLKIELANESGDICKQIKSKALEAQINLRYFETGEIGISLDETTSLKDVQDIIEVFANQKNFIVGHISFTNELNQLENSYPAPLVRKSPFLTHKIFNTYHSEIEMMRYLKSLEQKDVGLDTSMIPLGSCTMKLNSASEMIPVTWTKFSNLHPFVPLDQSQGYQQVFKELESSLCEITGLAAVSLQPNSGAQGEFAGLMVIRSYQQDIGQSKRNVVLIPSSAHGTNPASAKMVGHRVIVVACEKDGNVDVEDLRSKAQANRSTLSALMLTYPSTHGVFEESICEICSIIHDHGGQVYMDGANMNAQIGLTNPALIGVDVVHLNLHKTFAIPHGGGGPGMGPIAVANHLKPYLPGHVVVPAGHNRSTHAISASPWGSSSILLISYGYISMLGAEGLTEATKYAILNANYIKVRLEKHYDVLYTRKNGRVAHEMIFDLRPFKKLSDIDEQDVAKRLMDYGFHAPTVSFPVPGTMMIEPTESESKEELDRFCDAMIAIRKEIQSIIDGKSDRTNNVLKNAPHTAIEATRDNWPHPYTREQAVYALPFVKAKKFWPSVSRINNAYGDRNLICNCPPVETYSETTGLLEIDEPQTTLK